MGSGDIERENVSGLTFNQFEAAKQVEAVTKDVGKSLEVLRKIHADMVQRQDEEKVNTKEQNSH